MAAGGCSGPLSTLDGAGPAAAHVANFWWVMLAGATAIALLVFVLLLLAFMRRGSAGRTSPTLWIGGLGVAMPIVVLLGLVGYALMLGERIIAPGVSGTVVIDATGRQWSWEFSHRIGDATQVTHNEMHMPAGRPVVLRIAAFDVIHSFWVPRLAGKMDAIPGQVNLLRIQAEQPGVYEGQCAEFCGSGHSGHLFRVIAHDEAGWTAFQQGEWR
jgi:cytochrome c oxidase subunit II